MTPTNRGSKNLQSFRILYNGGQAYTVIASVKGTTREKVAKNIQEMFDRYYKGFVVDRLSRSAMANKEYVDLDVS